MSSVQKTSVKISMNVVNGTCLGFRVEAVDYIGVVLGLSWDSRKEHGNCYVVGGLWVLKDYISYSQYFLQNLMGMGSLLAWVPY